ncbi:hypothetical protein GCM10022222_62920 [Amycolatopsis ultiminotia]|uniref:VOC domain-containing protein n=1 Tax=Amycolatopsis ultiminotia TaxID=543629 RepID=A0ABP6XP55_9PSEU
MTELIERVDHTGITVPDLEAALRFRRDVLGFEETHRGRLDGEFAAEVVGVPEADIRMASLLGHGHRIELLQYDAPADRQHLRPRSCDVGSVHLALRVRDLDAFARLVAPHGWEAAGAPQTLERGARQGSRFGYFRDAAGTTIEAIQPA